MQIAMVVTWRELVHQILFAMGLVALLYTALLNPAQTDEGLARERADLVKVVTMMP